MNFSAYLASSSESEEEGPEKEAGSGEEGEEEKEEDKAVRALRYKVCHIQKLKREIVTFFSGRNCLGLGQVTKRMPIVRMK